MWAYSSKAVAWKTAFPLRFTSAVTGKMHPGNYFFHEKSTKRLLLWMLTSKTWYQWHEQVNH